ncbi:hypothetical protein BDQ17DRAFT_1425213 [Cyathus striatus]|nr:hypothetical protein BDQ17DRAFT_1425213 [Cyathus striatus]
MEMRIQSCLEFSRMAPLSITLVPSISTPLHRAVEDIASHAHRWSYISVDGSTLANVFDTTAVAALVQKQGLSQLRTLKTTGFNRHTSYNIFQGATALENFTTSFSTKVPDVSTFPWANMKRLSVIFGSGLRSREWLTWSRNSCMLRTITSVVTLPYLRLLHIECSPELHDILHMLRVPRLTELKLVDDIEDVGPLLSMIRLSSSNIKKLELRFESSIVVLQILRELRSVEELSLFLMSEDSAGKILSKLIWPRTTPKETTHLLPSLRKLKLYAVDDESEDLVGDCIYWLGRIMRTRSSAIAALTGTQQLSLAPLSAVEYAMEVPADQLEVYDDMSGGIKKLGEELDIEIDMVFYEIDYIVEEDAGSLSPSSSPSP